MSGFIRAGHTPGPWISRPTHSRKLWQVLTVDPSGPLICELRTREADACLIAAAPDLYKALFELGDAVLQWMDNDSDIPEEVLDAATDALKKARGTS